MTIELLHPYKMDPRWAKLPAEVRAQIDRSASRLNWDSHSVFATVPGYEPVRVETVAGARARLAGKAPVRTAAPAPKSLTKSPMTKRAEASTPARTSRASRPAPARPSAPTPTTEQRLTASVRMLKARAAKGDSAAIRGLADVARSLAAANDDGLADALGMLDRVRQVRALRRAMGLEELTPRVADRGAVLVLGATGPEPSRHVTPAQRAALDRMLDEGDAATGVRHEGNRLVLGV